MKCLLTLVTFFALSQTVSAQDMTDLQRGDLSLTTAEGEIVSIKPICPSRPGGVSCRAIGAAVTIKVHLHGCADRLGGTFSKFEVVDGRPVLYFGAINIANEVSRRARCITAPFATTTVHVPHEGDIELINMDFAGLSR